MSSFQLEDDGGCEVTISNAKEVKFIGVGITTDWADVDNGTDADPYDMNFTINAAQTGISSIYHASLKVGRDCNNQICFATDNHIIFKAHCNNEVQIIQNSIQPVTCNGAALGAANQEWSDLFLACGAVINFATSDVTLTHSAKTLNLRCGSIGLATSDSDGTLYDLDCGAWSGITGVFQAAEALAIGEVVSLNSSGKARLAKAAVGGCLTIGADYPAIGVATATVSACAWGTILLQGFLRSDSLFGYSPGKILYAPEAAASCQWLPEEAAPDTDGDMVQVIGWAREADIIYVNPDFTVIEVSC